MAEYWGIEWSNANSLRAYPLTDDASRTDTSGDFTLPDDFLVGIYLPVHAGLDIQPALFFVRTVTVFGAGYTILIAYNDGTDDPPIVATATIPKATHTEGKEYTLPGVGDFEESVGKIAIGRTESIDELPAGEYTFEFEAGKLDPDCIRPMLRGVSSLRIVNGSETSEKIFGDVELAAGNNIRLTLITIGDQDPQIRIDAISGEGLSEDCSCNTSDAEAPPIRTINGVAPNSSGEFTLIGTDCLQIQAGTNSLQLVDKCAEPCCGCNELEVITTDLSRVNTQSQTSANLIQGLATRVDQFSTTVLASTFGHRTCVE